MSYRHKTIKIRGKKCEQATRMNMEQPNTKPNLEDLSQAKCIAIRRLGELIGYETYQHRYFQDSRRRWRRAKKLYPIRRSASDTKKYISDWDLGNFRTYNRYTLTPVTESEALARVEGCED